LVSSGDEYFGGRLQRLQAGSRAVLDFHFEAASGPQALYGRRRKHGESRLLDARESLPQTLNDLWGIGAMLGALLKRLQRREDRPGIGAIRARGPRKAGDPNRMHDAGDIPDDL
jgi:hypothetical protein